MVCQVGLVAQRPFNVLAGHIADHAIFFRLGQMSGLRWGILPIHRAALIAGERAGLDCVRAGAAFGSFFGAVGGSLRLTFGNKEPVHALFAQRGTISRIEIFERAEVDVEEATFVRRSCAYPVSCPVKLCGE